MWELKRATKLNLRMGDELCRPPHEPLYILSDLMFRTNGTIPSNPLVQETKKPASKNMDRGDGAHI
jgi:hypothetical protein